MNALKSCYNSIPDAFNFFLFWLHRNNLDATRTEDPCSVHTYYAVSIFIISVKLVLPFKTNEASVHQNCLAASICQRGTSEC